MGLLLCLTPAGRERVRAVLEGAGSESHRDRESEGIGITGNSERGTSFREACLWKKGIDRTGFWWSSTAFRRSGILPANRSRAKDACRLHGARVLTERKKEGCLQLLHFLEGWTQKRRHMFPYSYIHMSLLRRRAVLSVPNFVVSQE